MQDFGSLALRAESSLKTQGEHSTDLLPDTTSKPCFISHLKELFLLKSVQLCVLLHSIPGHCALTPSDGVKSAVGAKVFWEMCKWLQAMWTKA